MEFITDADIIKKEANDIVIFKYNGKKYITIPYLIKKRGLAPNKSKKQLYSYINKHFVYFNQYCKINVRTKELYSDSNKQGGHFIQYGLCSKDIKTLDHHFGQSAVATILKLLPKLSFDHQLLILEHLHSRSTKTNNFEII